MRRILPALGLFFLSPLVAEFLLGNLPINALYALVVLAPLYGGGALLIREAVRRAERGWPSILILALAYGVLEEGIATMSLFNPNYVGLRLLDNGYIPQLGIGGPWTVLVLTLHVIWSIGVPIAMMEALVPAHRTVPWLGRVGLAVTAVVFVLGVAAMTALSIAQSQFVASVPQLASSVVIAAGLVVIGLIVVRPQTAAAHAPASGSAAPEPWVVGVAALVASSAFKLIPHDWAPWLNVTLALGLAVIAIVSVWIWSHRRGWGDLHRLALAAGPMLTYAWTAFPQPPVMPASPAVDLAGNAIFAAGAVALIAIAALRLLRRQERHADEPAQDGPTSVPRREMLRHAG